ncbi:conserved hypothetical protein [Leishmania braziliensis MHOM/BR/75/M2904]|uniref:Uncharacterized protein n=2 Tax=Leishmania braziliensis TaxID=5660 RepID=A4HMF1_LEIBR|nr:conserved hypothetical protein [Leishmania braziliensis MHOM/BR/75/M2904]CAJ2480184.1 unnamed protein product [Leishmania braziliensis]CAM43338.2 conserved hypothetical protein [Leishmania braziliensis MHOM/BR/75/M2904]SYZ69415.1 hypothetical_protein [Leishmania braziliensis MHOM/BR/75/M2904]
MTEFPPAGAGATTIFIRCATLHSRGELLNGFFFAHRAALGIQDWYVSAPTTVNSGTGNEEAQHSSTMESAAAGDLPHAASSPRLPPHFPVEVLYVRNSRKPYFLLEWRYPTPEEEEKRKEPNDSGGDEKEEVAKAHEAQAGSSQGRVAEELLRQLAERTLALGKHELCDNGVTWKGQPVLICVASSGMTVMAERRKLELRDSQRKVQRAAEKRERADADTAAQTARAKQQDAGAVTAAFIPRCVRRRT